MFDKRYECRQDPGGTWSVFDTFTGRVCLAGDRKIERLSESDALEITEILNETPRAVTVQ